MNSSASVFSRFLSAARGRLVMRIGQVAGRQCAGCGMACQTPLCEACLQTIVLPSQRCRVCGLSVIGVSADKRCKTCVATSPPFESLQYAGNYEGVLADCIVRAKIAGQPAAIEALRCIQRRALAAVDPMPYQSSAVLAMPIPKWRLMQRGFNLPALLAVDLSAQWGLPRLADTVAKLPLQTKKQALMRAEQRKQRQHHYQLSRHLPPHVMIVDDIVTTGQTVKNLAQALRQNGVQLVTVWALARTQMD